MTEPHSKRRKVQPQAVRTVHIDPIEIGEEEGEESILLTIILGLRHSFPIIRENGKDKPIRPIILKTQV